MRADTDKSSAARAAALRCSPSAIEFHNLVPLGELSLEESASICLSTLIGSISFAGSIVAFAKLQELVSGRPIVYPGQQVVNGLILGSHGRLTRDTGWQPEIPIERTLSDLLDYWRARQAS